MAMVFAELERELIAGRTKEAMAVKKAQGQRFGRPRLLPKRTVQRIVRARKRGQSLATIADKLNADGIATAQGGRQWYPSTIAAVLRSIELDA